MSIFKDYMFSWWQVGIFKLALLSFGVAIGAYWHEVFSTHFTLLLVMGIALGIYLTFVSLGQR